MTKQNYDNEEIRAFIALEINNPEVIKNIKNLQSKLVEVIKPQRIKLVEPENIQPI